MRWRTSSPAFPRRASARSRRRREAARAIARKAATRAAGLSGALALPPGVLGMLTVLPDLIAIWRIQAQLVSDIAGLYGKELQLTRSHMVYCLFRHAATQFTRDVVVRAGQRLLVRQLSGGALKSVLTSIGMTVTQRVAGTTASRWVPVLGAAAVAGYAYYDTLQVAKTAVRMLETPALGRNRTERRLQVALDLHRAGAPAAIHAASVARSSSVMPVRLPIGIDLGHDACS